MESMTSKMMILVDLVKAMLIPQFPNMADGNFSEQESAFEGFQV